MKFLSLSVFLLSVVIIVGCSSVKTPKAKVAKHDSDHDIPAIDYMIVSLKKDYIDNCYMPVVKREPPENSCQTDLFQMLERRYHSDYDQHQVDMASDDLFFKDVNNEIRKMVRTDPEVRHAIRSGTFHNTEELLSYYKSKYSFSANN